jgi:putative DNA primase/helicase
MPSEDHDPRRSCRLTGGPPIALRRVPQWLVWRFVERNGRTTKVPFNSRTGRAADVRDAAAWSTYSTARRACRAGGYTGIGFAFTRHDPFCGIDLDHAIDGHGNPLAWAGPIVRRLATYAEVSPSGRGVKLFCRATLPRTGEKTGDRGYTRHRRSGMGDDRSGIVELYDVNRFFTVTGHRLSSTAYATVANRQAEVESLHRELFAVRSHRVKPTDCRFDASDEAILKRALAAANGAKFAKLWAGDASAYNGDESARDAALCACLAFYTSDPFQIERLFARSGCLRPKWETRSDYRERTIRFALSG